MDENKLVNYFFVAGLPEKIIDQEPFACSTLPKLPIIDIVLINKSQGEISPSGYECLEFTPTRYPANLNHGGLMAPEIYICFKRGRNTPPVVDIGITYQSEDLQPKPGCQIITKTPYNRSANVSNISGEKIYLNFCRAEEFVEWDTLAVSDICIILPGKGEHVPYAFHKIEKNLNLGVLGSDIFLCYRKSFIKNKCLTYNAELLFRYPKEDHPSLALPTQLPMFCLPLGATIERWCANSRHPLPVFSTFVLTDQVGQKCYGASVVFYKDFDAEFLSKEQEEFFNEESEANGKVSNDHEKSNGNDREKYTYQQNQSICLISKWPFFDAFKKFLLYLYRISVSGPQAIPIERYVSQFFNEIPFPSPERPYVSIQLTNEEIVLVQPDEIPLPKSGASFSKFLLNLGPDVCLAILVCVLLEHKIVIHSIRPDLLTCVAETVSMVIFPFTWQCPYVPLCPLQLSEIVYSPTPFIIGLDSCYFDNPDPPPPSDITYVDLDAQSIKLSSERSGDTTKILPKKAFKALKHSLEELYESLVDDPSCPGTPGDLDCHGSFSIRDALNQQKQRKMDIQIQECFLRFMACLLKGYRSYLLPVSEETMNEEFDLSKLFDVPGFLKSHDKSQQKFLSEMLRTQYFCHFLEGRSLGSKGDAGLSFFDDCLQKLSANPNETLVEVEEKLLSERTTVISFNDNLKEIPDVTYNYNGFTNLNSELFTSTIHNVKSSKFSNLSTRDLQKGSIISLRRNKQEVKIGQNTIACAKMSPEATARCLLWSTYSLWYMTLPSLIERSPAKNLLMALACRAMLDLLSRGGTALDEVPFKIFFQLCGMYDKPQMALKVFKVMKKHNMTLNVTTYGYYNSAVLEKRIKAEVKGFRLWRKLSLVVFGIKRFKLALLKKENGADANIVRPKDSAATLNDFRNVSNKSPNFTNRSTFARMSLRNTIFKRPKPKNEDFETNNNNNKRRTAFNPADAIRQLFQSDAKKTEATSGVQKPADDKFHSCDELKRKAEESDGDSSGPPTTPERRNASQASTPLPNSPSFFKNDSFFNFWQSTKQNVKGKLSSPSRNSLDTHGRIPEVEGSKTSGLESNPSISSLSESADHFRDATATPDVSSISSSQSSIPLHKKHKDVSFVCQFPHLSIDVTSQMKCRNCSSLLYDEDIMAAWNLTDSDLNTRCYCCSMNFVPMLHISIKEQSVVPAGGGTSESGKDHRQSLSELEVQYFSPIVVRKELENMLYQKGDGYIGEADLIDDHAIIFWNLLWHISKLGLPTHLKQIPLKLKKCNLVNQVVVRTLWDSPHTHVDFGLPMYALWKEIEFSDADVQDDTRINKSLLQQIISGVISTRIPVDLVLQERSKSGRRNLFLRDIFHDILFLSIFALNQKNFDIDKFELQYETACDGLPIREKRKLMAADQPPMEEASWCRRVFRQLLLP